MYEGQTKEVILQRMLDATGLDVDKRQGSITYDMLSPAAIELALAYIELDNLLNISFADTTYGSYLDMRASELGLTRYPAIKAIGELTFTGTNGISIPVGTQVRTDAVDPVYFVTTGAGTIASGTVTVPAEALVAGASGNVGAGYITVTTGNITGVTAVTNADAFYDGSDVETDAELLVRYYERVRTPATSGNAAQYKSWAKSVAGVSDAKVFPIWNGNGTVKVVLLDDDKTAPTSTIVTNAATYIESVRPIGATVTVVGATEVTIAVSATVTLAAGATLSQAQASATTLITNYFKELAFTDPVVRLSKVGNVLLDSPYILDYSNLKLNNATSNVTIADGSVAILGTVTLT